MTFTTMRFMILIHAISYTHGSFPLEASKSELKIVEHFKVGIFSIRGNNPRRGTGIEQFNEALTELVTVGIINKNNAELQGLDGFKKDNLFAWQFHVSYYSEIMCLLTCLEMYPKIELQKLIKMMFAEEGMSQITQYFQDQGAPLDTLLKVLETIKGQIVSYKDEIREEYAFLNEKIQQLSDMF